MRVEIKMALDDAREWLDTDNEDNQALTEDLGLALAAFDAARNAKDWRGCLAACESVSFDWASGDRSGFVDLDEVVAAIRDGLVLYEVMPAHLHASHDAAGNWGVYPHNGAIRALGPRGLEDGPGFAAVRAATASDVTDYDIDTDGDWLVSL